MEHKKELGQYFTISEQLQKFVFEHVYNKGCQFLEPSFGAGHLLKKFKEFDVNYPMVCYEIDDKVKPVVRFNEYQLVIYDDFTKQTITQKFMTIIGNPPYVKQSKTSNLYIEFIKQCYNYLDDSGELIFIVPSDFIKLTSAASIIETMKANGSFTHFLFPHNEKLFENANIDIVVFRYEKGLFTNKSIVNNIEVICNINKGIITFSDTEIVGSIISEMFNVYVGIVSGRDEVYKVPFGNIDVLTDKTKIDKFIFTEKYPSDNDAINEHLLLHKDALMQRKIKKFTEKNWYEWGAPRNITSVRAKINSPCIYVKNMTRNKEIAFIDKVQYFGGTLLCLIPKNNLTEIELQKVVKYMNTDIFQKDYMYAGRFKIGHKQVSNVIIPT